jgi:hypothetical protein
MIGDGDDGFIMAAARKTFTFPINGAPTKGWRWAA